MSEEKKYDVDVDAEVTVSEITEPPEPPTNPPEPEPGPPGEWVCAEPGSTGGKVTKITNPPGVGFNSPDIRPGVNAVDVAITGGGDSAFMFGAPRGDSEPRLVVRCEALNVASGNTVSYGKHGIYGDATIDVSDFRSTPSHAAASGVSFRWGGVNKVRRAVLGEQSNPFPLPITFYDSGEGFGTTDIDEVTLWASENTAIWASVNPDFGGSIVQQHFLIGPQVEAHVAGGSLLFNAELWDARSTVTVSKRATVNGKPVTVASIGGVPGSSITMVE